MRRVQALPGAAPDVSDRRGDMPSVCCCRRGVLGAGLAAALLPLAGPARADDEEDAKSRHPKAGDRLVYLEGPNKDKPIKAADIKPGGPQTLAWPYDPVKKLVLDGTRLNQVLLVRLDPASLSAAEKPRAADGIVAFSAVCTHAGCTVTGWMPKKQYFLCPCHGSEYDPKLGAKPVFGPAPRSLAALPLEVSDGVLTATGGFIGRVGFAPMM